MDEIVILNPTLFLTSLGVFSPFSPYPLLPLLLHSTDYIQCWSLCYLHVATAIFAQLFGFPYFVIVLQDHVTLPSIQLPYLIAPSLVSS